LHFLCHFCLFEGWGRQKYSFPSPRVSLGGTRSFLSKNLPEHCTANHGVWIKCIFEQLDRISNVVACLPQAGLPPTPKPTGCVLNCSTMHKYPTLNLYWIITLASTQYFPEEKTASAPCMGWAVLNRGYGYRSTGIYTNGPKFNGLQVNCSIHQLKLVDVWNQILTNMLYKSTALRFNHRWTM
jgi:hypothetical protein